MNIQHHPSSNFDERPAGITIDTVVIHATVLNTLTEVIEHFSNPEGHVSCHYTIDRDGIIVSHVPENARAWHAGLSRMKDGRTRVNDFSIGIELVNLNDGKDPFPQQQIEALRELLRAIAARHPIKYVIPHSECAEPPGRKTDPKGFDPAWVRELRSH
jgi:N-acetylmuramoyl-L-alanine amidase